MPTPDKITNHFSWNEATYSTTAKTKGIDNTPSENERKNIVFAAVQLEQVRELLGVPLKINSWFRNPETNAAVGGSKTSDHMSGLSIDFVPTGVSVFDACHIIAGSGLLFDQLIYETNARGSQWVHIGFGERMRRQVMTKKPSSGYVTGLVK